MPAPQTPLPPFTSVNVIMTGRMILSGRESSCERFEWGPSRAGLSVFALAWRGLRELRVAAIWRGREREGEHERGAGAVRRDLRQAGRWMDGGGGGGAVSAVALGDIEH